MIRPSGPTFDQHHDGFGVQNDRPRVSWKFLIDEDCSPGWTQAAYEIQVDEETFYVASTESVLVPWPAGALCSRQIARVRVRSYGCHNEDEEHSPQPTCWSSWSAVEAGLLTRDDWTASLITTKDSLYAEDGSLCPVKFSKTFCLSNGPIRKARLYITSHGVFEANLNGTRIGDHVMSPGWTSYHHRLCYEVFDVSKHLRPTQDNVITVEVGAGWFASALAWHGGRRCRYGRRLAVLAQLEIELDDRVQRIRSDGSWTYSRMAITSSEIYNGETWDLRNASPHPQPDLSTCTEGSEDRQPVVLGEFPSANMLTSESPPVRVVQVVPAVNIFRSSSGKLIVDFGQNLVGRIRVNRLYRPPGTVIKFQHAEVMENGELGTRPLRTARCVDTVILGRAELLDWTPKFTFHGFRYVQVDGGDQDHGISLTISDLAAEVLHTDFERTGTFECSHPMLNKLHENTVWSMRGNFLSIPTDCPQRDERLGWTGDIAIFAPSASFLFNVTGMLGGWLQDLAIEQSEPGRSGVPPLVVPSTIEKDHPEDNWWPIIPQAIWGDATILVPWSLYETSGDVGLLKQQFQSMQSWLDAGVKRGDDGLWDENIWQLGDWLDPTAPPEDPGNSRTDGTLVADAYLVHVTHMFQKIVDVLGLESHRTQKYGHEALRTAFQEKYVTRKGLLVGDSQTILTLAISFGLLEEKHYQCAAARLARHVRKSQFRIATGFAGTPFLCHALTQSKQTQLAYRVVLNRALPSWMYPIEQGATTIWERWDSMLPNGEINSGEMTSFNHYALGSVVHWLHKTVGGISSLHPGWREIRVEPVPGGTVTYADTKFDGPYGTIRCQWTLKDQTFNMNLTVPPSSRAYVLLPRLGDSYLAPDDDLHNVGRWVPSGKHHFECRYESLEWPPQAILPPFWDQTQPEYV